MPTLQKTQVKSIKQALAKGTPVQSLASKYGVGYMVVYRIATGKTWSKIEPRGRITLKNDYASRRRVSLKLCEKMAIARLKKGLTIDKVYELVNAKKSIPVSRATIARALRDGKAAFAVRVHRIILSSGDSRLPKSRFGITDEQIDSLVTLATGEKIPSWVRKEIEDSV